MLIEMLFVLGIMIVIMTIAFSLFNQTAERLEKENQSKQKNNGTHNGKVHSDSFSDSDVMSKNKVSVSALEDTGATVLHSQNKEVATLVEKNEYNHYDFSNLSKTFDYMLICLVAFFVIKYSIKLFRSTFNSFYIFKEQKKTFKLIKAFNKTITNDSLIIQYADSIEEQSVLNNIILKTRHNIKLEALNQELINKKEIINNIINKKYTLN